MLAMNYRGPFRVRADHKPDPVIEHPGDAIVRVTRSCICGSDLHLYHGLVPDTRVGTTFGHEFVGIVEEVGSQVTKLKVGDRVLVPFNVFCGSCFFCQKELYGNCHNTNPQASAVGGIYGYSHTAGGYDGGQAEFVRVPMADIGPTVLPADLHEDDAVLLTDALPTGYQAAEMGDISEGDTVVVFGAGPVGIFAAKSAWLFGAGRVIVVDHVEYRLDFVRRYAQCEVVNFREVGDMAMHIKKMTDWLGADVCIDAVGCEAAGNAAQTLSGVYAMMQAGSATALHWAINSVRKGGNVSIVGVYGPTFNAVPIGNALNKGLTLRMNQASVKRHLPRLIEHIQAGRIDPKQIITHRVPLEEVADAYHIFSSKLDNCIKTVLIPPSAREVRAVASTALH
ncbi:threonine dehydrogenase-like Zn-dependent dehydrogenase [Pseudoduganella flava]|uniref:Alcohol dehydrogenase catalytic domain-containing protein n=1 Tax=Pseudoduganella flava TaxID=871742 RepID=A0A562PQT8_9BURK|nr:zinc-dependent alcohol dehydrogenase [Pseudoduganella flava]QGZ42462.1 alcohol dehydrogenase catalytic domain-containing protein [Pseudoduganella flava]TWI46814.1 threonine dehydrogenase-like Zn-dependent dehydrogenase [Pseudoduganella flava]